LASNDEVEALRKDFAAEFRKAEETLKVQELELYDHGLLMGLLMPAVNQLRYAGSHLVRTLDSRDLSKIESNLRQAISHCRRATFDSLEVQVRYYLGECDMFTEQFKSISIVEVLPYYPDDRGTVEDIRDRLPSMLCAGDDRGKHLEDLGRDLSTLKKIAKEWANATVKLNKNLETKIYGLNREHRRRVITTLLGAVVAIIAGVLAFFAIMWR